jgi:DNA polymerase-1
MDSSFSKIWFVDFEFQALPGEQPRPICMVARELASGRQISLFGEELLACSEAPYSVASDSLFVAYMASAELGCHLALGWPLPENVLDLYVEFRNAINGIEPPSDVGANSSARFSLLQALQHYGLDPMPVIEKDAMRELAMRGGPWTTREQAALLAYCAKDCESLIALFNRMSPRLDMARALLRGWYMKAVAHMEHTGVPINTTVLSALQSRWPTIHDNLIAEIDAEFGVYDGRSFRQHGFRDWLRKEQIDWPLLDSGARALDERTFRHMAARFTQVEPLRQLRSTLSQLRKLSLPVGADGRGRTMLSPFAAKTGRNQPSTTKFIFGLSAWSRHLMQPEPGRALAYIDWEQQEFGIAAGLSKDEAMIKAYRTGDPISGIR